MKKNYSKPVLIYENFSLMDAITASCMVPAQHADEYTCAWYNEDFGNIFTLGVVAACEWGYEPYEIGQDVVFPS